MSVFEALACYTNKATLVTNSKSLVSVQIKRGQFEAFFHTLTNNSNKSALFGLPIELILEYFPLYKARVQILIHK